MFFHLQLVVIYLLVNLIQSESKKQYILHRDLFQGFKSPEFTVYDNTEKIVHYRIESDYGRLEHLRLVTYPTKQKVGVLNEKRISSNSTMEFSIIHHQKNKTITNGTMEKQYSFLHRLSFTMKYQNKKIRVQSTSLLFPLGSVTITDSDGLVLASFYQQYYRFLRRKIHLGIFSDRYSEEIYLLAIANRYTQEALKKE